MGFANEAQTEKAVTSKLDFENAWPRIQSRAAAAAKLFASFQDSQNDKDADPAFVAGMKKGLRAGLRPLRDELDEYLARDYGDETGKDIEAWKKTAQPFHWYIEFYTMMQAGGFDVIIGNPPYVEYSKVKENYQVKSYTTESCGNIYAYVVEHSLTLMCKGGYFGMIVPLSLSAGERLQPLRKILQSKTSLATVSNFEIFPSKLFDGAFQRLCIVLAADRPKTAGKLYMSKLYRWYSVERPHLIEATGYTCSPYEKTDTLFPKLVSEVHRSIIQRLKKHVAARPLDLSIERHSSNSFVYYQEATNYWMKATCRVPFYKKNGVVSNPGHGRFIHFADSAHANGAMAILNSSLFYLWFATYSDGFHLSDGLVRNFPCLQSLLSDVQIVNLALLLDDNIKKNATMTTRNTKVDAIEIEQYKMSKSKPIIDQIDRVLAKHYGFTDEETDFIINYDIKYRMGRGGEADEGE